MDERARRSAGTMPPAASSCVRMVEYALSAGGWPLSAGARTSTMRRSVWFGTTVSAPWQRSGHTNGNPPCKQSRLASGPVKRI